MRKIDLLILCGLIITLVAVFTLRVETLNVATDQILENQRLIKESLNVSNTNNKLIISNQEVMITLLNKTNTLEELVREHILTDIS